MITIYLIRHAAIYNPNKLCIGQSEIPLEENFTTQFDWIIERIPSTDITEFYSSPIRRCSKLAQFLSNENYQSDDRIKDQSFGLWEMQPWEEIPAKELEKWQLDFVNAIPKKGENLLDVNERVLDFLEEMISNAKQQNMVITTHANVIRLMIAQVLDFPLENTFNLQIDYSSITKITYNPVTETFQLVYLNLTADAFIG